MTSSIQHYQPSPYSSPGRLAPLRKLLPNSPGAFRPLALLISTLAYPSKNKIIFCVKIIIFLAVKLMTCFRRASPLRNRSNSWTKSKTILFTPGKRKSVFLRSKNMPGKSKLSSCLSPWLLLSVKLIGSKKCWAESIKAKSAQVLSTSNWTHWTCWKMHMKIQMSVTEWCATSLFWRQCSATRWTRIPKATVPCTTCCSTSRRTW